MLVLCVDQRARFRGLRCEHAHSRTALAEACTQQAHERVVCQGIPATVLMYEFDEGRFGVSKLRQPTLAVIYIEYLQDAVRTNSCTISRPWYANPYVTA